MIFSAIWMAGTSATKGVPEYKPLLSKISAAKAVDPNPRLPGPLTVAAPHEALRGTNH